MTKRPARPPWVEDPSFPTGAHACPKCGEKRLMSVRREWMNGRVRVIDRGTRCSACGHMVVPPDGVS